MFGEYESENPRVPSPWDPFLPSPPSESSSLQRNKRTGVPKLVPEVEEGNVEYKLKLTQISPSRFTRLVTQLKWRLLEGGGQAYYELGVADSGALIGLTRSDLEESLETLEMMAGEIGASVIIVKEIEVPPILVALADKLSGYLDPETGEWADKMSKRRSRAVPSDGGRSETPPATEAETELSTADSTDFEDASQLNTPVKSGRVSPHPELSSVYARHAVSHPERPTAQSSPAIAPIDDDLALFSMEPEPEFSDTEVTESIVTPAIPDVNLNISVDIEIASVYKPRPIRRRPEDRSLAVIDQSKRSRKLKQKKAHPWRTVPRQIANEDEAKKKQSKRAARDKQREEKRKALLVAAEVAAAESLALPVDVSVEEATHQAEDLVSGLEALHVTMEDPPSNLSPDETGTTVSELVSYVTDTEAEADDADVDLASPRGKPSGPGVLEPRLIVEALVVRKLSIDEGSFEFGDFSGFALS